MTARDIQEIQSLRLTIKGHDESIERLTQEGGDAELIGRKRRAKQDCEKRLTELLAEPAPQATTQLVNQVKQKPTKK